MKLVSWLILLVLCAILCVGGYIAYEYREERQDAAAQKRAEERAEAYQQCLYWREKIKGVRTLDDPRREQWLETFHEAEANWARRAGIQPMERQD